MIELINISFKYDNKEILKNINLKIEKGERVVLLGINGSGKSTLLKIIDGLLFVNSGKYLYKGVEINERNLKNKDFVKRFRKEVALLFQNPDSMLFNPTVYDEIAFGLRQLGLPDVENKVKYWADKLNIYKYLDTPPFNLSGGEKQKVCLASLLVLEPEVLLLDEPMANLDPYTTGWLIDMLSELNITTITTTHNLPLSVELGDRAVVLAKDEGILYDGNLKDFLKDTKKLERAKLVYIPRKR